MLTLKTKQKIIFGFALAALFIILTFLLLSGGNLDLIRNIASKELSGDQLQKELRGLGARGYLTFAILSMLQVILPFLPAEPAQVLTGITFGFPLGLLCCMTGIVLGNALIFLLYRIYGNRLNAYFNKNLHVDFEKAARSKKIILITFILYFLPAIPYGMICLFAAGVGMKFPRYMMLTLIGSLPSVIIGVALGNMAVTASWIISLTVFLILAVLLTVVFIKREYFFKKFNAYLDRPPYSSKTRVRPYSPKKLILPYIISRIVFFFKGIKVKYTNKVEGGLVEAPSVVLCNHGSFIDFAYAGTLLMRQSPNFVVARLYFYHKLMGNLLRGFGCFPKSMFTFDLESAQNCLRVLKSGRVLAMMPEARLSTAGRFEDIQDGTYPFLKKVGMPVYTVKIKGDYLADPKWGKGLRRGSLVEAELDILLSADEVKAMSVEEIRQKVEERLYYDEFEFLEEHPRLKYRSRRIAEGLENILTTCPKCHKKFTLYTKKDSLYCENCGKLASVNSRYAFEGDVPYSNFSQWYYSQKAELETLILSDPNYSLSAAVELKLPSADGKSMLRHGGQGVCTLNRQGLVYEGDVDGENKTLEFPIENVYRLLFGAGENFEVYSGSVIHYFVPEEKRSCVEWYMASAILADMDAQKALETAARTEK